MLRRLAYKFRLKVTPRTEQLFRQFAGCARYVYNRALALNEERRAKGEKRLNYFQLCKEATAWRSDPETLWLSEVPTYAIHQALKSLERAYVNFLGGRTTAPAFKKRGKSKDSFGGAVDLRDKSPLNATTGRFRLPRIGWVRYFNSRPVEGKPKNVTVSLRAGKWYLSIQTEREVSEPAHPLPGSAVGVDVGVVHLATLSTGEHIPPVNAFRGIEPKLKRLQRSLSRKVRFSQNWKKAKEKVARLHSRAANRRNDHLHKTTTAISKNHALVVVEDLNVAGMSKSAKGTVEKPGRNVAAKSGLNKAIRGQGWATMVRQLEYKATWRGGKVVKVNPAFTSQTCHRCGLTHSGNRPSQARFACLWCGWEGNADVNAANVILAAGHAVIACGGAALVAPVKQEPIRASG